LAKIKAERAEAAAREAAEQAAKEEEQQMRDIATGNPLLNKGTTTRSEERWCVCEVLTILQEHTM
jgi:hypothetical protein